MLDSDAPIDLTPYVEHWSSLKANVDIEDLLIVSTQPTFQKLNTKTIDFGFSKDVHWLRFSVNNQSADTKTWWLRMAYPSVLEYDTYLVNPANNEINRSYAMGRARPYADRPISHRHYLTPITLDAKQNLDIYIRAFSDTSLRLPLTLEDPNSFLLTDAKTNAVWLTLTGILLSLGLYNLFVYFSVKQRSYLYYVGYIWSFAATLSLLSGQAYQVVWTETAIGNQFLITCATGTTIFFFLRFIQWFLDTPSHAPTLYTVGSLLSVIALGISLTPFLFKTNFALINNLFIVVCAIYVIALAYRCLVTRSPLVYYFIGASVCMIFGSVLYALANFKAIPQSLLTEYGMPVGAIIEAILLSLGLAYHVKKDRHQRYLALKEQHKTALKLQRTEETLIKQITHDGITGLPNHAFMKSHLADITEKEAAHKFGFAVVVVHLSRFGEINKTLGKSSGDILLQRTAQRLKKVSQQIRGRVVLEKDGNENFCIGCLDGVSFLMLVELDKAKNTARHAAEVLVDSMDKPIEFRDMSIQIDAAVGIAYFPEHGYTPDSLLQHAYVALEKAKTEASSYAVYSSEFDNYSRRRLTLMGDLKNALDSDSLALFMQPQYNLKSKQIESAEALLRWHHPKHGNISPMEFVPLAEQCGLIKPLTQWVLTRSIKIMESLAQQGIHLRISVNLSARNMLEADLVFNIHRLLRAYKVNPKQLVLEVTESSMMANPDQCLETLNRLRQIGVTLSLDDFGTGYSSLTYLKKLPLDEIKIDRSFVMDMRNNSDDRHIVQMILQLSHQLKLRVVAEGVEDKETLQLLTEYGSDYAQGYFISRPMEAEMMVQWLEESDAANLEFAN